MVQLVATKPLQLQKMATTQLSFGVQLVVWVCAILSAWLAQLVVILAVKSSYTPVIRFTSMSVARAVWQSLVTRSSMALAAGTVVRMVHPTQIAFPKATPITVLAVVAQPMSAGSAQA